MLVTYVLLAVSFVLLVLGAFVFTNAIEWAGARLDLGRGAVGSVLAAVATALPESVIPVVAILTGQQAAQIAIGAIIGAPFLLGTLGMLLVGATALILRRRRTDGERLRLDQQATTRDLLVFLPFLAIALVLGLIGPRALSIAAAIVFVVAYGIYVWRTVTGARKGGEDEDLTALFFDPTKQDPPRNIQIIIQLLLGLGLIVGGAHLFVTEVEHIARQLGISALVLALVLAPLASELPEKLNSVLWVRTNKDALALGNITGAMVFQSMLPVAFGLAFTNWQLSTGAAAAAGCALAGGALCLFAVHQHRRFPTPYLAIWAVLYVGCGAYIIVSG